MAQVPRRTLPHQNPLPCPFTTSGAYDATGTKGTFSIDTTVTGAVDLTIAVDITGLTQYGTNFAINTAEQNGYSAGQLSLY
jgi:hypothetical protein